MSLSLVVQFHCTMFHTTLFPGPLGKCLGNKDVFHGHSSLSEMIIIIPTTIIITITIIIIIIIIITIMIIIL